MNQITITLVEQGKGLKISIGKEYDEEGVSIGMMFQMSMLHALLASYLSNRMTLTDEQIDMLTSMAAEISCAQPPPNSDKLLEEAKREIEKGSIIDEVNKFLNGDKESD